MFNLRDAREYEGYSMSQLANKLNKSKSAYARWESEKDIIPCKHPADRRGLQRILSELSGLLHPGFRRFRLEEGRSNVPLLRTFWYKSTGKQFFLC